MPLQFILGPSGSGKSQFLYKTVVDQSIRNPRENFIVLVPEQFTMQTQRELVDTHPRHGIMNIDVLSFARLAYRIFEETGGGMGEMTMLDDQGKNLILRKIAEDHKEELTVLKGKMNRQGYISEVKSVLSELSQYDITAEDIERVEENLQESTGLRQKLSDIRLLFEAFEETLAGKHVTKEELLKLLYDEVPKSLTLKNSTIVLDGFTGFTPVQIRLIGQFMIHCKKVVVTATVDSDKAGDLYALKDPLQMFAITKQMLSRLVSLAKELQVEIKDPVTLFSKEPYRFAGEKELAHLEANLFRYPGAAYEDETTHVRLFTYDSPRDEAYGCAAKVRELTRKENLSYNEIGVVVSDMDTYGAYLEEAFAKYEIPAFIDEKRDVLLNPYVEYVRSALAMISENFSYKSVFRFLRTGLTDLSFDEIDRLENYVIALGIRGYKKWNETWARRRNFNEQDVELVNASRVKFLHIVDKLRDELSGKKHTVGQITVSLYDFMEREDFYERLKSQQEKFEMAGELALAKEYSQLYGLLLQIFEQFYDLLGDEPVTVKEYGDILDAGLEEARIGVLPPSMDEVMIGDLLRTRFNHIKALLFLGASDDHLPGNLIKNGLLTEFDRGIFAKEKLPLSPCGKEKAYEQKFYLYANLTKPSERLFVSYAKVGTDLKGVRPSYLVSELLRIFPKVSVTEVDRGELFVLEETEKTAFMKVIKGLQEKNLRESASWKELYAWYKKKPEWQAAIRRIFEARFYRYESQGLGREADALYGERFKDSISRMETFSTCAFKHFVEYGLYLRDRDAFEFDVIDIGDVCHKVLELFANALKEEQRSWAELPHEEQEKLVEECVAKAIADYKDGVLYDSYRNRFHIERLKNLLKKTVEVLAIHLGKGDFIPEGIEFTFPAGKIDRIDTCVDRDKVYVKVIDYKTGRKAFDLSLLYYGLQLQLMVYMGAAMEVEKTKYPDKEIVPAGVFYYRVQDPIIKREANKDPEMARKSSFKLDGIANREAEALMHMDHDLTSAGGNSDVIAVGFKKDGDFTSASKVADTREFDTMIAYAKDMTAKLHERILEGETAAVPYRKDANECGCNFCGYRDICGFDEKISGFSYRELEKMDKTTALMKMQEALGKEE